MKKIAILILAAANIYLAMEVWNKSVLLWEQTQHSEIQQIQQTEAQETEQTQTEEISEPEIAWDKDSTWCRVYPKTGDRTIRFDCEKSVPIFKSKWTAWKGGKSIPKAKLTEIVQIVMKRMPHTPHNSEIINLVVETAIAESKAGYYIRNKWGDHGIFQIKERVAEETLNWIEYAHPDIFQVVMLLYNGKMSLVDNLEQNIPFGVALCISEYWRKAGPEFHKFVNTQQERAILWKSVYNTRKGLGTVEDYIIRNANYGA